MPRTRPSVLFAVAALVVILLALPALPITGFARPWLPAGFTVLEGSRLLAGRVLRTVEGSVDRIDWRWCPARGLVTFCVESVGRSGRFSALATPSWQGLILRDLRFQGISLAAVAPELPLQGRLDGRVNALTLSQAGCALPSLYTAEAVATVGNLMLMGRPLADHRLQWLPATAGRGTPQLHIEGEGVAGQLQLNPGGHLAGRLQMVAGGSPSSLDINLPLPCTGAVTTGR